MSSKRIKDWFGGCFRLVKTAPRIKRWVAGLLADLASGIRCAAVNLRCKLLAWRRAVWYRVVPVRPQQAYRPRRVRLELERLEDILAPAALFTYTGAADGTTALVGDYRVNGQVATVLPGPADTIQFTQQFNASCTVSANLQVAEIDIQSGHSASVAVTATLTPGWLSEASGTTMVVGCGGTVNWNGGVLAGQMNIYTGGTLNIAGANPLSIVMGGIINDSGVATWTGAANNQSAISMGSYGAIDVQSGGVFNLSANTTESITGDSTTLFLNDGQVSLGNAGTLWIGAPAQSQGGTFNTAVGSQIDFYGATTVDGATSFTGSGTVAIGATMTIQGEFAPAATVTFVLESTGTLSGATGALNIDGGTFNWVGGTISGTLNIWSGTLNISEPGVGEGGNYQINGGSVNVFGTANWTPDLGWTDTIYLSNNGSLNIAPRGDLNVLPGTTTASITSDGSGVLSNSGSLVLAPGAFLVISAPSTSTGTYNTGAGTISFFGAGVFNDGTILTGTGGTIGIDSNMTLKGTTFQERGTVSLTARGILSGSGTLDVEGVFNSAGGTLQGAGTVNIGGLPTSSGTINGLTINGFDLNDNGTLTWAGGNIILSSGTLADTALMTITGQTAQAILPGAGGGSGAFVIAGSLEIRNPSTTTFDCGLSESPRGILTLFTGSLIVPGDWTQAGGTINLNAQTSLQVGGGSGFAIQGTMNMASGTSLQVNGAQGFTNNGILNLLASQVTVTVNGAGFTNQGTVNVAGTFQTTFATALFINSGMINFSPAAQLNLLPIGAAPGGNFEQTATGEIDARISPNSTGGFSSSLFVIRGTARYGSTFALVVDPNGPAPGSWSSTVLGTGGGCNGVFATLTAPLGWTLTPTNTGVGAAN